MVYDKLSGDSLRRGQPSPAAPHRPVHRHTRSQRCAAIPLMLLALVTLACGSFAPRPTPIPRPTATPTALPLSTDTAPAASAASATATLPTSVPTRVVPTPTFTPTPEPGTVLIVGQPARITAPGGLNARRSPSVKGDRIGRFQANERVIVLEGPVEADDYRWWRVGTNQLAGWVAEGSDDEVWLSPQVSDRRPVRRAVRLGDDVIVTIGEGGFLKVRTQPGLSGVVQFKLDPSTQLSVIDGPVEADNYRWWKVTDGKEVTGWAAEGDNSERWLTPLE